MTAATFSDFCLLLKVSKREKAVRKKVYAIALTDSVHTLRMMPTSKDLTKWLQTVGIALIRIWISFIKNNLV